jgi:hypothetical protein
MLNPECKHKDKIFSIVQIAAEYHPDDVGAALSIENIENICLGGDLPCSSVPKFNNKNKDYEQQFLFYARSDDMYSRWIAV